MLRRLISTLLLLAIAAASAQAAASSNSGSAFYIERQVSYAAEDGAKLAGTLTLPKTKAIAAVVLVKGSGPADRDDTMLGHKPFQVLAEVLARAGIASLRTDDRGVGGSTGDYFQSTGDTLAADVIGGMALLEKEPGLSGLPVGVIGHSLGGQVAALAATKSSKTRFAVLLSSPALPDAENAQWRLGTTLRAKGMPEAEVRRYQALLRDLLSRQAKGAPPEQIRPMVEQLVKVALPPGLNLPADQIQAAIDQQVNAANLPFMRYFSGHEPTAVLRQVRCPVLAIFGSLDTTLPPENNFQATGEALREAGNEDRTVLTVFGVNHLLQSAKTGSPAEYEGIKEAIAPRVLRVIVDWITGHANQPGSGNIAR